MGTCWPLAVLVEVSDFSSVVDEEEEEDDDDDGGVSVAASLDNVFEAAEGLEPRPGSTAERAACVSAAVVFVAEDTDEERESGM